MTNLSLFLWMHSKIYRLKSFYIQKKRFYNSQSQVEKNYRIINDKILNENDPEKLNILVNVSIQLFKVSEHIKKHEIILRRDEETLNFI
jgi:hypothetical protein